MSTRKIMNAKDLSTNELIYFRGHAKATYMSDGITTVEDAINSSQGSQSDWNETDTTSKSYIANKPNIPTKTSELENDSRYAQFEESSVFGSKVLRLDAILSNDGIISNAYELTWNNNGLIVYDKSELENVINITKSGNGKLFLSDNGTYLSISTSYPQVNHGTSDTRFALTPNILHVWDEVAELSLKLADPTDTTVANEYLFQFTSGATATILTLPDTIKWVETPSIESDKIYQISILNNCGTILGFV